MRVFDTKHKAKSFHFPLLLASFRGKITSESQCSPAICGSITIFYKLRRTSSTCYLYKRDFLLLQCFKYFPPAIILCAIVDEESAVAERKQTTKCQNQCDKIVSEQSKNSQHITEEKETGFL